MKTLTLACLCLLLTIHSNAATWYVNHAATGANNGTSWADAFTLLTDGIAASSVGDQIWVAQGVYKPTLTTNRNTSFILPTSVALYGGFNGTETQLTDRNIALYTTTLSGDIGTTGNANDNSYHVVRGNNLSSSSRLDGFSIMHGNTYYDMSLSRNGGGIYNFSGSPTIANCTFRANNATDWGGAVSHAGSGNIKFLNCNFIENTSGAEGGAILIGEGTATFQDCNISLNESGEDAGAIYVYDGTLNVDRCVLSGNTSAGEGGAIYMYDGGGSITNSLIVGNSALYSAGIYCSAITSKVTNIINCTIADNNSTGINNEGAVFLIGTSTMSNCILWGNSAGGQLDNLLTADVNNCIIEGGYTCPCATAIFTGNPLFVSPGNALLAPFDASAYDYHIQPASSAIDAGSNASVISIYNRDLDSLSRTHGSTVDIGAYEDDYCTLTASINGAGTSLCPGESVTLTAAGGSSYLWSNGSTTADITVSAAGTYSVTAVNVSGCRGSASQQVTVYQASVTVNGGQELCTGETISINATGTGILTYSWSTGDISNGITIDEGGTYSVTITTNDGCTAADSHVVAEVSNPVPAVTLNGTTLATGSFDSYQWLFNGADISGATASTHTPTQNGNYSVRVTNSSGCTGTSAAFSVTNVGIRDIYQVAITAYPNPVSTELFITELPENVLIEILDVSGKVLLRENASKTATIQMEKFGKGVYFLRTENGIKKIVKI